MYVAIHEGAVEKDQSLLKQCSYFIDVLEPRHQFIYYLYKGYYQMLSGQLEESLHTLCFADGLSVLEHREILYSMYGRLYYYRREIVLAIESVSYTHLIVQHGLVLTGGGALLKNLDTLMRNELMIPVYVAENALHSVVDGCNIMLQNL